MTVATGQSYTGSGAVTLSSGGANALGLDTGGGAAINIGATNATSFVIGGNASATIVAKAATSSTTAFTLQGAGGAKFMILDSTNNRLQVGDTSADATGVLLVLDTKNTTGEPTEVDGGMYYNSAYAQYRCGRDGNWENCGINPIDRGFEFSEDFVGGLLTTGNIGDLNWNLSSGGVSTLTYNTTMVPTADRPGTFGIQTNTTSGNGSTIWLGGNSTTGTMIINGTNVIKTAVAVGATTTNDILRVGLHTETTTSTQPISGVWWEADASTNANWRYCYGTGAVATCAASAVAIAASTWVRLEIRVTAVGAGASNADFFINGTKLSVASVTIDSTNKVNPAIACFTSTVAARNCYVDYYQLRGITSAAR